MTFTHAPPAARFFLFGGLIVFWIVIKIQDEMTPPVVSPALTFVPNPRDEQPVSASPSRVDALCASLPKPEQFEFVSKTEPNETKNFVSISYTFRSSRAASEIYPSFIVWLTQNGWTDNKPVYERLEFSKDRQTIWIAPFHTKKDGDFFTVNCTEWKLESETPLNFE